MEKEYVYLTDITLHVRGYRPTLSFSKVAEKGRMYSPFHQSVLPIKDNVAPSPNKRKFTFQLPSDLQKKIDFGKVELMIPEDGLFIYPGKDLIEYIESQERKERNQIIHNNTGRTWHKE